jgi:hypothetical protein
MMTDTHEANGVFWYCCAYYSMGFAPNDSIELNTADSASANGDQRLSWHLDGDALGGAGYRLGNRGHVDTGLLSDEWRKVIMGLR